MAKKGNGIGSKLLLILLALFLASGVSGMWQNLSDLKSSEESTSDEVISSSVLEESSEPDEPSSSIPPDESSMPDAPSSSIQPDEPSSPDEPDDSSEESGVENVTFDKNNVYF